MAAAEGPPRSTERHGRRHPFATWMKRIAGLKHSSSTSSDTHSSRKRGGSSGSKGKKPVGNPYPLSGGVPSSAHGDGHLSFSEASSSIRSPHVRSEPSLSESAYDRHLAHGRKSATATVSIDGETTVSETAHSKAGTSATVSGGTHGGGEGSTFSSPAPSVRSLTTTLTTVHSAAPSNQIYATAHYNHHHNNYSNGPHYLGSPSGQHNSVQFSHQFPTTPVSAVPTHLVPHPTTYNAATANNLLTDNASVLTLASSSKRRRRNSLDTNASVRALAPSSLFSGSRESLPLSVLSGHAGGGTPGAEPFASPSVLGRSGIGGGATERASVNSAVDRVSIRSGRVSHHTRNDSAAGSMAIQGRMSRRSSGWGEIAGYDDDEEDDDDSEQSHTQKIYETTEGPNGSGSSTNGKGKMKA